MTSRRQCLGRTTQERAPLQRQRGRTPAWGNLQFPVRRGAPGGRESERQNVSRSWPRRVSLPRFGEVASTTAFGSLSKPIRDIVGHLLPLLIQGKYSGDLRARTSRQCEVVPIYRRNADRRLPASDHVV